MTISLAFLASDLVKAAVEGRLPRRIGIERLSPSHEGCILALNDQGWATGGEKAAKGLLPKTRAIDLCISFGAPRRPSLQSPDG
jgi:hypothetical protein